MCKNAPKASVIGTSSVRRERMLRASFPDARFTWIRGNVPTRVQRVREGEMRGDGRPDPGDPVPGEAGSRLRTAAAVIVEVGRAETEPGIESGAVLQRVPVRHRGCHKGEGEQGEEHGGGR